MECIVTGHDPAGARTNGPRAVVLGQVNCLSVIRNLGRRGVPVTFVGDRHERFVHSRYCDWMPLPHGPKGWMERARALLLGPAGERLAGSVLLPCDDPSAELLACNRAELAGRFLLPAADPGAHLRLLDKLSTYGTAVEAGVPTPRFWPVSSPDDVEALRDRLVYPLIVKPLSSIRFQQRFGGKKHVVARELGEARQAVAMATGMGLDVMLVERIPGPDSRLCSYYTYIDEDGEPLLHFTKRIIRRSPPGMGTATYHVTDWIPEIRDLGLRLLRHVGWRGLAQVEFMLDARDGVLKLMEANVRFTQPNSLLSAAGVDLAALVYSRAAGLPYDPPRGFRCGLRLWDPVRDVKAYRELRARGEIDLWRWLASLRPARLDTFSADDPMPTIAPLASWLRGRVASPRGRVDAPRSPA
jgi:D-aspartate ligase